MKTTAKDSLMMHIQAKCLKELNGGRIDNQMKLLTNYLLITNLIISLGTKIQSY